MFMRPIFANSNNLMLLHLILNFRCLSKHLVLDQELFVKGITSVFHYKNIELES